MLPVAQLEQSGEAMGAVNRRGKDDAHAFGTPHVEVVFGGRRQSHGFEEQRQKHERSVRRLAGAAVLREGGGEEVLIRCLSDGDS